MRDLMCIKLGCRNKAADDDVYCDLHSDAALERSRGHKDMAQRRIDMVRRIDESLDLQARAIEQRTCQVCGGMGKPTMQQRDGETLVDYDCECGNTWTGLPIHEQARLRTKDIRKDAP